MMSVGAASSAAQSASRATPSAPPKIAVRRHRHLDVEGRGDQLQPEVRLAAATNGQQAVEAGAGVVEHALAIAEGEGDPLHHRLRQARLIAEVGEPDEGTAGIGIVVRRALAAEIGEEDFFARPRVGRFGEAGQLGLGAAGDVAQPVEAVGSGEGPPPSGARYRAPRGRRRARRRPCWGGIFRWRRRSRRRCRQERSLRPGGWRRCQPAAALSPAPPAMTTPSPMPQRRANSGFGAPRRPSLPRGAAYASDRAR